MNNLVYFILVLMFFCHIVDDYYLQGWLASAKQRSWWEQNAPSSLYRYDYLMALFCHALSWSIMISLPVFAYLIVTELFVPLMLLVIPVNIVIHAIVDDLKANKKKINLIIDQLIHFAQIILTWLLLLIII